MPTRRPMKKARTKKKLEGILVTVTGHKWNPGTMNIRSKLTDDEYELFVRYLADQLRLDLIKAIDNQRWKHDTTKWPPLSMSYMKYKQRSKLSLNIWEATGFLRKSIKVFERGSFLAVGFKKFDVYPDPKNHLPVNLVASWVEKGTRYHRKYNTKRRQAQGVKAKDMAKYMEYGGVKMKPRPLFRPVQEYMRKHVDDYFKRFKKEVLKRK